MIVINPGSGPVAEATDRWSHANIHVFVQDLRDMGLEAVLVDGWMGGGDDGRWCWKVDVNGRVREVDMPGIPVDQVRFLGGPDQNARHYPRLYVDGSSWLWKYALNICSYPEEDEE